jgi:hypothetical protein
MKHPASTPDRWVPLVRILAGVILAAPSVSLCRAAEAPAFDVDVTLTNDFDKSFTDLPVFLHVSPSDN